MSCKLKKMVVFLKILTCLLLSRPFCIWKDSLDYLRCKLSPVQYVYRLLLGWVTGDLCPGKTECDHTNMFFSVLNKIKVVLPAKPRLLYDNATIKPVLNYVTAACLERWSKDNLQSVLPQQKRPARIILDGHRNILSFFSIINKFSEGSSILWGSESFKDKSLKNNFFNGFS